MQGKGELHGSRLKTEIIKAVVYTLVKEGLLTAEEGGYLIRKLSDNKIDALDIKKPCTESCRIPFLI